MQKFQTTNDKSITVKGTVKVDERADVIFGWLMHLNNNERLDTHMKQNGNLLRTCDHFEYSSHTFHSKVEVKSPNPFENRSFSSYNI